MSDLYSILGVDKDATKDEIRRAYRVNAKKYHPDKNGGDEKAADLFKQVKEAYEVLSNPAKRGQYDKDGTIITDDLYVEAVKRITEIIILMVEGAPDPERMNLLAQLKLNINGYINGNMDAKRDIEKQKIRYKKLCGKFKKKKGHYNIFDEAFKKRIELMDSQIATLDHNIDVAKKMNEVCNDYDYQLLLEFGSSYFVV